MTDGFPFPFSLQGHRILVTGASSGLGREAALLISRLGGRVVLVGRNEDRLNEVARELAGEDHRVELRDLVKQVDGIPAWLKQVAEQGGVLNGLVHAAGVQSLMTIRTMDEAHLDSMLAVHVKTAFALTRGFRQKSVRAPSGSIVFLSSVMGLVGEPARSAYSACKGALVAMTKSLALELAPEAIRVNCLAPGFVETAMWDEVKHSLPPAQVERIVASHPLGLGRPLDIASAIVFLLAPASRWITGSTLVVDGGYTAR